MGEPIPLPVYFGLSGLVLPVDNFDLGGGVRLSRAFGHVMTPFIMAFGPPPPGGPHPGPWRSVAGGSGVDITAQLEILADAIDEAMPAFGLARFITFLLRLYAHPAATVSIATNHPIAELPKISERDAAISAVQLAKRHLILSFAGETDGPAAVSEHSLAWVAEKWRTAGELAAKHNGFKLAVDTLDMGQFVPIPP